MDTLCNQGTYTYGYSICACPLCVLENGDITECYNRFKSQVDCKTAIFTMNISLFSLSETPRIGSCTDNEEGWLPLHIAAEKWPLRSGAYPSDLPVPEDCTRSSVKWAHPNLQTRRLRERQGRARPHSAPRGLHSQSTTIVQLLVNFKVKAARVTKSPSPDGVLM